MPMLMLANGSGISLRAHSGWTVRRTYPNKYPVVCETHWDGPSELVHAAVQRRRPCRNSTARPRMRVLSPTGLSATALHDNSLDAGSPRVGSATRELAGYNVGHISPARRPIRRRCDTSTARNLLHFPGSGRDRPRVVPNVEPARFVRP
jgi:hypothetical protein